jgi:hypothetical protein
MPSRIRYVKQKISNRKHAIINDNWQHGNAGAGKLTAPGGGGAGTPDAAPAARRCYGHERVIAGLLAGGVVELRRGGVSVLATAIVIGFCAILGGGRLWLMALGYSWKEERGLAPGTPIPAKVKKSRWWRIGLVYWAIFNMLATIAAITYAASGDWANFSEFGMGALLSWIGFAIAASGKVPSRDFRF